MTRRSEGGQKRASYGPPRIRILSTKYWDGETGLIHFTFRDYNPEIGRWISRDPMGEKGSLNLYAFVLNNPNYYFDPYGAFVSATEVAAPVAIAISQIDSPLPGPADLVAGAIIGIAILIDTFPDDVVIEEPEENIRTFEKTNVERDQKCYETVYRVFGQQAKLYGKYWTPVNPKSIPDYRNKAGLPTERGRRNSGKYLATGLLIDETGVIKGVAVELDGNVGGWPEYYIPHPEAQVDIISVERITPSF